MSWLRFDIAPIELSELQEEVKLAVWMEAIVFSKKKAHRLNPKARPEESKGGLAPSMTCYGRRNILHIFMPEAWESLEIEERRKEME